MSTIYMSSHQLAQRWCMSPKTLERWRWEGNGPQHLKVGGKVLYPIADVVAFEQEGLRQATAKHQGTPLTAADMAGTMRGVA